MTHVHFPYQYPRLPVDASHERFVVDHNRCILCTRCVRVCDEIEGAHTWDVMARGVECRVITDLAQPWGESRKLHRLRQVRAGVPHGRAVREGKIGRRNVQTPPVPAVSDADAGGTPMTAPTKVRLATVWLDGCSGCHMSLLDIDERLIDLAQLVDVVWGPLVDAKEFPENVDVTLVEGAVSSEEDLHRIRLVRARTKILVSLGDCAVTGNVPAMRNQFGADAVLKRAYLENATLDAQIPRAGHSRAAGRRAPGPRSGAGGRLRARLPALGRPDLLGAQRPAGRAGCRTRPRNSDKLCHGKPSSSIRSPASRATPRSRIHLDEQGHVEEAYFHVTQFRGFEKFCEGRPFYEMPSLMARICGICPVSHLIASAKACDAILAVRIPEQRGPPAHAC